MFTKTSELFRGDPNPGRPDALHIPPQWRSHAPALLWSNTVTFCTREDAPGASHPPSRSLYTLGEISQVKIQLNDKTSGCAPLAKIRSWNPFCVSGGLPREHAHGQGYYQTDKALDLHFHWTNTEGTCLAWECAPNTERFQLLSTFYGHLKCCVLVT